MTNSTIKVIFRPENEYQVHSLADVEDESSLSKGCIVWRFSHVREGAKLGKNVMIGNGCFVDVDVMIGEGTRIQNSVSIYSGTTIGKEVFIAPNATFSNCRHPMIRNKETSDFFPDKIVVEDYATIGINSTLISPIIVGEGAFVGGGSVVTSDVFPYTMVYGNPAKMVNGICRCRTPISKEWVEEQIFYDSNDNIFTCVNCNRQYKKMRIGKGIWEGRVIIVSNKGDE